MNLNFLKQNIDITLLSGFKTKAIAKYFFEINLIDEIGKLREIQAFCEESNLPILFIGKGTNMLFAFDEYSGVVIKNNLKGWRYDEDTKILKSYSGELISMISSDLKDNYEVNIWERFIGLPGTIGAAIAGNAGCFGLEAKHNFLEAEVYNLKTRQIEFLNKEQMQFGYRNSILKQNLGNYFLINIRFDLSKVVEKYSSNINILEFRKNQPKGFNSGSFFKNPSKENPAGKLIEEVGLKGYNLNGAYFSEKHANFLMNDGNATYKDLIKLINLAIEKIKKEKGIELIPEVIIVKN